MSLHNTEGLAREVEAMRRRVAELGDQHRLVLRSGSIVVIDKLGKRAIRVHGLLPDPSTKEFFETMGWRWIDRVAGEQVD